MSLLPRRLRAGQPGHVAVHPGWTLSPPAPESAGSDAPYEAAPVVGQPASRWTSSPAMPALPGPPVSPVSPPAPRPVPAPVPASIAAAPAPVGFWVDAPAAPIATVLSAPLPLPVTEVEAALPSWTSEWEAVAATPVTPAGPMALHTAAAAALDAVFGTPAAPAVAAPVAPAPVLPVVPVVTTSVMSGLTALDLPLPVDATVVETPLAAQAVAFLQAAAPVAPPVTRTVSVPAPAQQLVEQAVRTATSAPVQRRSTVRLGFTDASVIDLRPDDPMAKALHTVADALIGRDVS